MALALIKRENKMSLLRKQNLWFRYSSDWYSYWLMCYAYENVGFIDNKLDDQYLEDLNDIESTLNCGGEL